MKTSTLVQSAMTPFGRPSHKLLMMLVDGKESNDTDKG